MRIKTMLYAIAIEKGDEDTAYGVIVPDIPGCFSAGDTLEEAFENVCFGQYEDGLEEYINFSQTGELQYLINLFAIFYLRKGEVYDAAKSKKRAKGFFKHIDIRHLYGFYLTFSAIQLWITSGEIYLGGNLINLSIIYQDAGNSVKSNIPGIGMKGVVFDIAESQVFGNYQETRREIQIGALPP